MKYNELVVSPPKAAKRPGRGIAAGQGKTAGRGTKGQNSRTGSKRRPGFAGGQNPLMQQLPKLPGFRSSRTKFEIVHTNQLGQFKGKEITNELLFEAGLIENKFSNVKLVFRGDVETKVTVKLQAGSQNAIASLQQAGGSFEKIAQPARPKTSKKDKQKS